MKSKLIGKKGISIFRALVISAILIAVVLGTTMCAPAQPTEPPPAQPTQPPAAPPTEEPVVQPTEPPTAQPTELPPAPATEEPAQEVTMAILHFSVIEGTTWSGAQDRAAKRIVEKYPNEKYIYRKDLGPA